MGNMIQKVKFLIGVVDQVLWLKDELQSMQCFLNVTEGIHVNNVLIRKWIRVMRELALDAEDAIEIFTLKVDAPKRKRNLVRQWVGLPSRISHGNRVRKEIESIRNRLEILTREKRSLGKVGMESSSTSRSEMIEQRSRMAILYQKDEDVVGLNEDTNLQLKNVILNEKKGLSLAAIVGMGGIGKSTLARKVYNHPDVAAQFEKRAW
ncbi:hypothetical protein ACS0TY_004956 [Phlomoides rotata]